MADNLISNKIPKLRFNDFFDSYTTLRLHEFTERITKKNKNNEIQRPLTISAQYGLIDQQDFFNKQIASKDMSNYYILEKGEFAYNKSYSNGYPFGAIKRLDFYDYGNVSNLYICFKLKNKDICSDYVKHYFESDKWHKQILYISGEGARNHGLLNLSTADFFETKHSFPGLLEQKKIANFLNLIDKRIDIQINKIKKVELYIIGLRDKIFSQQGNDKIKRRLGDFLTLYSELNLNNKAHPVAVGRYGIRYREEIYNRELASDYTKNKLIFKDTLTIGMGSSQIDIGILTDDKTYCVSPAYTTYRIHNINSKYLDNLLIKLNPLLSHRYMIISARQGKSVNKDELLNHEIYIHDVELQIKIAELFDKLNQKLDLEKEYLDDLYLQRKYLLKNMFI